MTARAEDSRTFPGGRARLPRLGKGQPGDPELTFVGTAFVRTPDDDGSNRHSNGAFSEYFTTESLFDEPPPDEERDLNDPYHVLGIPTNATWPEVVTAHRRLAKAFHPDRFAGQPDEVIARADNNIKYINRAYAELNRRYHPADDH